MATSDFQPALNFDLSATILDGQTTSNAIDLAGTSILAFITDAALNGIAFTFLVSNEAGGTYLPLHRMIDGAIVTAIVDVSRYSATNPADFASARFLKIVSGTAQSGADTVITIVNRRLA
jgi:hypothetical protein